MRGIKLHILREGDQSLPISDLVPSTFNTLTGLFAPLTNYTQQNDSIGTPTRRAHPLWQSKIRQAWLRVFRYCLFARRIWDGAQWNTSGIANGIGGNFFLVTLGNSSGSGNWDAYFKTSFGATNRDRSFAGTFMHELGHTLGLRHGGPDHTNNKPNYFSVMNYLWQFPKENYASGWGLDYSRRGFTDLNENSLNENSGIGGRPGTLVPISTPLGPQLVSEVGPVDFNWNRVEGEPAAKANVNGDRSGGNPVFSTLTSQEDWSKLTYRAYGLGWEQDPSYASGDAYVPCVDFETFAAIGQGKVNGRIILLGFTGSTSGKPLTVSIWKNGAVVETQTVSMGDNSLYTVSPVTTGDVVLKFQLLGGLVKAVPLTLGTSQLEGVNVNMLNGDCSGDNYIGTDDYLILNAAFDTSTGDAGFDPRADLNGDGYVGTDDYLILNENFDMTGD